MTRYADKTEVSSERSQAEIRGIINRYGAMRFATLDEPGRAVIMFEVLDRRIRFSLPLPDIADAEFDVDGRKHRRNREERYRVWEQACRQRWRALALCIKAKLEAVETGIATFEEEFLNYVVLADGKTVGEHVIPRVAEIYAANKMMPLLPDMKMLTERSGMSNGRSN
jgi:hypothetical protein